MERLKTRRLRMSLSLVAAGAAALSAAGASAMAATGHTASHVASACANVNGPARHGRIAGIVRMRAIKGTACAGVHGSDPFSNGDPPLWFHGGNVMGTASAGAVVITPIFWDPPGHGMSLSYKKIITTYLAGVAAESGTHGNVFSVLGEYFGTNGAIRYMVKLGKPINDSDALPPSGCTLESADRTGIYADGSGYNACIDDAQLVSETNSVVGHYGLKINLAHVYVVFLPKHVETCFLPGSTATNANACTINHEPSAAYCAYHSMATDRLLYANLSFPIYQSPVGFTCGSDAKFPVIETPNGNADADTEISPTSHELMESITDPNTIAFNGWNDQVGSEIGDECAYVYGVTHGAAGARYNQVIDGHHYLTQEEFSNRDFLKTHLGCIPSE